MYVFNCIALQSPNGQTDNCILYVCIVFMACVSACYADRIGFVEMVARSNRYSIDRLS